MPNYRQKNNRGRKQNKNKNNRNRAAEGEATAPAAAKQGVDNGRTAPKEPPAQRRGGGGGGRPERQANVGGAPPVASSEQRALSAIAEPPSREHDTNALLSTRRGAANGGTDDDDDTLGSAQRAALGASECRDAETSAPSPAMGVTASKATTATTTTTTAPANEPIHDESPPVAISTQLGKVIVHRVVRELPENEPKSIATESHGGPASGPSVRVIIHQVVVEDESNSNSDGTDGMTSPAMQIQEMSDDTSSGDNCDYQQQQPIISEVESESETSGAEGRVYSPSDIETVQTLPLSSIDEKRPPAQEIDEDIDEEDAEESAASSAKQDEDQRQRRAQKRVALEAHFLPQLLSPRYLDSIVEENSDMSDARSDCSDNPTVRSSAIGGGGGGGGGGDDESRAKRTNAIFPKSHLDFSKRHKHGALPKMSSGAIREAPLAVVVEARLLEQLPTAAADEERSFCCSATLASALEPESEAAEVVYIKSASSSASDLHELALEDDEETTAAEACSSRVSLDTDASDIIENRPQLLGTAESDTTASPATVTVTSSCSSRESTPVNRPSSQPAAKRPSDILEEALATLSALSSGCGATVTKTATATATPTEIANDSRSANDEKCRRWQSSATAASECSVSAESGCGTSSLRAQQIVEPQPSPESPTCAMNDDVREFLQAGSGGSPRDLHDHLFARESPPPIPPPPRDADSSRDPLQTHATAAPPSTAAKSSLTTASLGLFRQESTDSHCSDGTNHSQCTVINSAGDHDHDPVTMTSPLSDPSAWHPVQPLTQESHHNGNAEDDDDASSSIKKLRLLCAETVASMPYGEAVLEELAHVAQNIGEVRAATSARQASHGGREMPYPLPTLPHIGDLRLAQTSGGQDDGGVAEEDSSWLGLPTGANPKLLVCLSPAQQRAYATGDRQPDELLDAHRKFMERRGYDEFSEDEVRAMNSETLGEQQILKTAAIMKSLRKGLTPSPPPPPIPPPPVPSKSSETAAKAHSQSARAKANAKTTAATTTATATTTIDEQTIITTKASDGEGDASARNANEQRPPPAAPVTIANGEQNQNQNSNNNDNDHNNNGHRLLAIIHGSGGDASKHKSHMPSTTSSLENNSRPIDGTDGATAAVGGAAAAPQPLQRRPAPSTEVQTTTTIGPPPIVHRQRSCNESAGNEASVRAASGNCVDSTDHRQSTVDNGGGNMQSIDSELARMFPQMGQTPTQSQKRHSTIEFGTKASPFCAQLMMSAGSQPRRYSNIETSSYESQRRIENGQVVYDVANSTQESHSDGDPTVRPFAASSSSNVGEIMSALKLNENTSARTTSTTAAAQPASSSADHSAFAESEPLRERAARAVAERAAQAEAERAARAVAERAAQAEAVRAEAIKNRQAAMGEKLQREETGGYEEFRQRAKAAAEAAALSSSSTTTTAPPPPTSSIKSSFHVDHEKLFKDFDALSQQLHQELESGRAQREQREKSASLYDLSRMQPLQFRGQFEELKRTRHAHMLELEREIERSMKSRQLTRTSMPRDTAPTRTYEIPIQLEANGQSAFQPPTGLDERSRRAESMFNLSSEASRTTHQQPQQPHSAAPHATNNYSSNTYSSSNAEDWSRYASDLGSSENIARPFVREVEICYQRQRPQQVHGIRAPRLSASTNDLSTGGSVGGGAFYQYDHNNAYNVRRTHAPMLHQAPVQKARPQYLSCHSMLERDPNPTYISTTSRRGGTPAPPPSPAAPPPPPSPHGDYERRQRRTSLPYEIHERQLQYISSKEEELKTEFERLQNERRRLMDEVSVAGGVAQPPPPAQVPQQHHVVSPSIQPPQRHYHRPGPPKLPTLSEDEVFRQQMAEEWLNKVAEREERRLQKIIKISRINEEHGAGQRPEQEGTRIIPVQHVRSAAKPDISEEFLSRVKERRSKLAMPADSDWESGAESQPPGRPAASSDVEDVPPVRVIEGQAEADLSHLPRHLREFARFSNHESEAIDGGQRVVHHEEERRQEANNNSTSSATKKSTVVKTVKISRQPPPPTPPPQLARPTSGLESKSGASSRLKASRDRYRPIVPFMRLNTRLARKPGSSSAEAIPAAPAAIARTAGSGDRPAAPQKAQPAERRSSGALQLSASKRRSWSESDLLREIDSALKLAKGFLYADEPAQSPSMFSPKFKARAPEGKPGIWTPQSQTPTSSLNDLHSIQQPPSPHKWANSTPPPQPAQQIWTPQPSPGAARRKEFRPVRFESPTLPRRYVLQPGSAAGDAQQPPWCSSAHSAAASPQPPHSGHHRGATSSPATTAGSTQYLDTDSSSGQVAPSASVSDKVRTFERSASASELDRRPFVPRQREANCRPFCGPKDVIYKVKNEYLSEPETEYDRPRKMAQLARRQFDGIGPVTNDGMPIILRSEVKEPHQHEWYKRLYQTIHKQKSGDDYVIRYRCPRARPQSYKSSGYQSEPEPNYESDYTTVKYRTLDRRRLEPATSATNVRSQLNAARSNDKLYGTMPNPIKSGQNAYKNQPGRIEDYVIGHSSVSEKERKEWWDEVMDIFNGHLDQTKLSPNYTEGNLSRALAKDSGYTSDSNLVFRKKEAPPSSALSPVEQKQVYKSVQAGGEPPLFGFRKPAPEKPRDFVEEVTYFQITPTLTKIRVSCKGVPAEEPRQEPAAPALDTAKGASDRAKPPATNMFNPFTKKMPSFIPIGQRNDPGPPAPPCRKTSRKTTPSRSEKERSISSRHQQCFQSPTDSVLGVSKYGTITLRKHSRREPLCRSKSAGAVSTILTTVGGGGDHNVRFATLQQRTRFEQSISPSRRQPRILAAPRPSSRSPVAFGRSISKERTFAEEKKRLENSLALGRSTFEASTNILRDPSLRSPQDVKQAMRSYATCPAHFRSKSAPRVRPSQPPTTANITVNTTMRHSMCVPQVRHMKPSAEPVKKTFVSRTKITRTETAKKPERSSSAKHIPKSLSVSVARTNSTYSLESSVSKEKPTLRTTTLTTVNATPRGRNLSQVVTLQHSKSDGNVRAKTSSRQANTSSKPAGKTPKAGTAGRPSAKPTNRSIEESYASTHYFHDAVPLLFAVVEDSKTSYDTVRDRAMFWNDFNAQHHSNSLSHRPSGPPKDYKYMSFHHSRSLSPRETYAEHVCKFSDQESDFGGPDDTLWRNEKRGEGPPPGVVAITSSERPDEGANVRKFSPTREVRVPQTQSADHSLERGGRKEPLPHASDSLSHTLRSESPCSSGTSRRFSPTREIRIPQILSAEHSVERGRPAALPAAKDSRSESPSSSQTSRKFSPTREVRVEQLPRNVRSPSRRKIDSCRSNVKSDAASCSVIRASSLSSADDRSKRGLYLCGELAHSATSLTCLERHSPTCRYRNNCERFTDLNRFYSTLERVGQLERATSTTSFKPIRKESELLDFDEWRQVRLHERAEKELNYLVHKLKHEQRTKDLMFRPRDVDDIKWKREGDFALYTKEKSVEDIRDNFERKIRMNEFEWATKSREHSAERDYFRPYWRRNTVADLASSLEVKLRPEATTGGREQTDIHLSNRLVSTLSKEQIVQISKQLNDIYASNNPKAKVSEEFVVTVDRVERAPAAGHALKVRCNSSITKEELLGPVMRKKQAQANALAARQSKSTPKPMQPNDSPPRDAPRKEHGARGSSPVMLGRETRGAIAAKNADVKLKAKAQAQEPAGPKCPPNGVHESRAAEGGDSELGAQAVQHDALLAKDAGKDISKKIQFFEEKQFDEPPKTIYHAREDSSPDEGEVMRIIEENMKMRSERGYHRHKELSSSLTDLRDMFGERGVSSGENFYWQSPPPQPPDGPEQPHRQGHVVEVEDYDPDDNFSPYSSVEMIDTYCQRSRSLSPVSQTSSYLQRVQTGEVEKIKRKFESIEGGTDESKDFFGLRSLRKVRSDPELPAPGAEPQDAFRTTITSDEHGDVSWMTHKFEVRNQCLKSQAADEERGRRRNRAALSPTPLKSRLMPHIDIISKTAALRPEAKRKGACSTGGGGKSGTVERIRNRYERPASPATPSAAATSTKYLSSSNPDIRDAVDGIAQHLSADWVAHKYPSPQQNRCPVVGAGAAASRPRHPPKRCSSTSPPRPPKSGRHQRSATLTSALKPHFGDIFANQPFDPKMHEPKARYVPDGAETADRPRKKAGCAEIQVKKTVAVTFQDYDIAPPVPPPPPAAGAPHDQNDNRSESPSRYLESDVNIHYKTPIRHEYKEPMTEEELAIRQAEHMQKLYQEERRRKYLQELQDMNSRRHTDNLTASQKSPIPLNRYDDFPCDLAPKSQNTRPIAVARALYNFQGQSARELSLRKGDVIYIRRQIDKNWYEGEHNAMIGLLPVNYVEIIKKDGLKPQYKKPSEGQARAKYNFQAQSGVELSLNKGELVTLTRRVDDNWFEGKIANRKGIFPVSYVEVLTDIGAEDIAAKTVITEHSTTNLRPSLDTLRTNINNEFNIITQNGHQAPNGILKETKNIHKTDALHVDTSSESITYRALYKYRPQNSDELELLEGDIVHVLEKCDDGWFVGTSQRTGCFGTFPGNYVERV